MLTIAYSTVRKDCRIEWFFASLHRECGGEYNDIQVVVVDSHAPHRQLFPFGSYITRIEDFGGAIQWREPKPNVWNGYYRLTKDQWFAAASHRNTSLCLARYPFIAFVDDLSVLMPGWLARVRAAMDGNYIVCGSYAKAKNMTVVNGEIQCYTPYAEDNRRKHVSGLTPCSGNWLYGCSVAGPVEAFLSVNGWPENICDGLGFEDCCMGIALKNAGHDMRYDPAMMTYESEELHHVEPALRKEDWHRVNGVLQKGGNGGDDCSHAALHIAQQSKWFEYDVGGGFKDLRALRQHVLNGGKFPVRHAPEHHWWTGVPLKDL